MDLQTLSMFSRDAQALTTRRCHRYISVRDKEDILRKSSLLRGSNIHVTEDMNRKTRESRTELRRFMRNIKRVNPNLNCVLQYDKLLADNKIFVWNDIQVMTGSRSAQSDVSVQGKVVEQISESGANGNVACPCSRSASVMTDTGLHSSLSLRTRIHCHSSIFKSLGARGGEWAGWAEFGAFWGFGADVEQFLGSINN